MLILASIAIFGFGFLLPAPNTYTAEQPISAQAASLSTTAKVRVKSGSYLNLRQSPCGKTRGKLKNSTSVQIKGITV